MSDTPDSGDQQIRESELPTWVIWWERLKEIASWAAALSFFAAFLLGSGVVALEAFKVLQRMLADFGVEWPLWLVATVTIGVVGSGLGVLAIDFLAMMHKEEARVNAD